MDLLLQAARVLELEHHSSSEGDDHVSSKSSRGTFFHQSKSRRENGEELDESHLYNGSLPGTGDDLQMAERTSRRVGGVGTREVHNQLEKNRRKQLREFFTHLQQCVPSLENKRVATQSILQAAIKHIKNLKKKDVEQEREIQTLARRKCDLKKRYNLELNKCTQEQQHIAGVLLKVLKSKINVLSVDQDGHNSDSTSTASECPSNEDNFSEAEEVHQPLSTATPYGTDEGRKRKLKQKDNPTYDGAVLELPSSNLRSGAGARSLVSSSSVALKHMLEQRKRNQTAIEQATSVASEVQAPGIPTRGPGSLTYSYPMITTHLASAVRPSVSTPSHKVIQNNHLLPQSPSAAVSGATFSKSTSLSSTKLTTAACLTRKSKKGTQIRSKGDNYVSLTTNSPALPAQTMSSKPVLISSSSPLTLAPSPLIYQPAIKLVQPSSMASTHDVQTMDISLTASSRSMPSVSNLNVQSFNYLGQAVLGSHTGSLTLDSPASMKRIMDTNISSHKIMPAIIPLSLAPIIRGLPVTSGLSSHMVALGSSPLALCSSTGTHPPTSIAEAAASSLLNSNVQLAQGTNYLLTSSPVTSQQNSSLALSTNNARIAALLAASSSHSIIKPVSPINSMSSTLCPTSIAIPVSIAQSLMPVSITNDQLATKTSSSLTPGSPLRIFTPMSQSSVLTASLANGQSSLMPTVVQLESSGKVALLHNLIHGRQLQVQNSHHILTQPIVVLTTPETDFGTCSSNITTSSSNIS